ncbi:MAG: Atxe2 family lasso peptide isopeptidase [Rhizomicrobium sp.]
MLIITIAVVASNQPAGAGSAAGTLNSEDLLSIQSIRGLSVSPDGRFASFVTDAERLDCNCHRQTWYLLDLNTKSVIDIDRSDEVTLSWLANGIITGAPMYARPLWSADGKHLLYIRKLQGKIRLFLFSVRTKQRRMIITGNDQVYSAAWLDNENILYATGRQSTAVLQRHRNEMRTGFRYTDGFVPLYQPLPIVPLAPGFVGSGAGGTRSMFASSTSVRPIFKTLDIGLHGIRLANTSAAANFSKMNTTSVLLAGETNSDRVYASDMQTYARRTLIPETDEPEVAWLTRLDVIDKKRDAGSCGDACSGAITDVFWSDVLNSFVFAKIDAEERDVKEFYLLDRSGQVAQKIGRINRIGSTWEPVDDSYCGVSGDHLIYVEEGPASPPRISMMSLRTGKRTALFDPNRTARLKITNKVERFSWVNAKGDGASAHLVYPSNFEKGHRYPLVLVQYVDNGFLRGGTGDEAPVFPIADSGMFVLDFSWPYRNPLAYARYKKDRERQGLPEHYENRQYEELDDMIDSVVSDLAGRGLIDTTKIAYTGLSAGAQYITYSLAMHKPLAAAITAGDGADAINWFLKAPSELTPDVVIGSNLASESKPPSPALIAATITTPVMINAADHEYLESVALFNALQTANKPVEMYIYPEEYHNKWQPIHRLAIYERNIDWLRFWLQGYEDSSPTKREQYVRWRKFRALAP